MLTRRAFQQQILAAGMTGVFGAGFVGCEQRKDVPASGEKGTPAGQKKSVTIGMIAKSNSNPVFLAARRGAEEKARVYREQLKLDVKVDWRTPNDEDAQKQAEFIEQLVAGGVDAITIACSDASKVTKAIDDAIAKGVVVMCFDSDAPASKRLCYVGTDDVAAGRDVMRGVAERLKGKEGVVAILAGNQTATNLQKRVRGAEEELKKHPHLKRKDVYYHKETPQDAYAMVESVQKANPEINGWAMIGGWPLMTERALPWQEGEVVCVSMDTLVPQLHHLRLGDVQLLLGQRYFQFGQMCVDILAEKVLHNKTPAKEVDFQELDPVTKENVDEYEKNWKLWS